MRPYAGKAPKVFNGPHMTYVLVDDTFAVHSVAFMFKYPAVFGNSFGQSLVEGFAAAHMRRSKARRLARAIGRKRNDLLRRPPVLHKGGKPRG